MTANNQLLPAKITAFKPWLAPVIIVLLATLAYALGLQNYLTLQSLADNRDALRLFTSDHPFVSLLIFAILYAGVVALSFPGASILTIAAGFLFGWLIGGLVTIFAATLGAVIIFQIAKTSLGESLSNKAGPFLSKLKDGFSADAFNYLLFLRLVPAFPFWLVNIAPALANVKLRTFASATFLGIIPGTFAFAFVGHGLDSIIDAQKSAHGRCVAEKGAAACPFELSAAALITTELLLAFAALGLVALIPVALKKWKSRHAV